MNKTHVPPRGLAGIAAIAPAFDKALQDMTAPAVTTKAARAVIVFEAIGPESPPFICRVKRLAKSAKRAYALRAVSIDMQDGTAAPLTPGQRAEESNARREQLEGCAP